MNVKLPTVRCPGCEAVNVGLHAACPRCGTALPPVRRRTCARCGSVNLGAHVECPFCLGPLTPPVRENVATDAAADALPSVYLQFDKVLVPLLRGRLLTAAQVPGFGPSDRPVGGLNPHPVRPDVVGLQNLSDRAWTVTLPDGRKLTHAAGETRRLTEGTWIDFGGPVAVVRAAVVSVDRTAMEELARRLRLARGENRLTREQFDRLHRSFVARDTRGAVWTVGLNTLQWTRLQDGRWIPDTPPDEFLVDTPTLYALP